MNEDARDLKRVKPFDEQSEFVMSFVDDSGDKRRDMEDIWDEVDDNYLVRPANDSSSSGDTRHPLGMSLSSVTSPRYRNAAVLKDPETHQEIMTLLSTIILGALPSDAGFISASSVGFEDIPAAKAINGLNEHAFRLPGHYWAQLMRLLYALLRGTGVVRWTWEYREEIRNIRSASVDPFTGEIESISEELYVPVWDDPRCMAPDTRDVYPDHGHELLQDMLGFAEHYRITAGEAMRKAASGIFEMDAVERAITRRANDVQERSSKTSESVAGVSPALSSHPDFLELDVYEYYGETPFRGAQSDAKPEDGVTRRVISCMNGETVRSNKWSRRLPYSEVKIIPRPGSFWGMSVGELVRYDQDFADTVKMMLADAVVRMTHPPMIYNKMAEVDLHKLRRFNPRVPIGANSVDAIRTVDYNPRLGEAFQMYGGVKGQMRDASSALDSLQGQSGPDRESATVGSLRYQAGRGRPEMFAMLLEREWLPADARIVTELYQEFLADDVQEIARRVGQSELPVSILEIMGDFDIKFIGSRQLSNRVQKIEAFREINAAASANPAAAPLIPWIMLYRKWFKDMGAEDIAAMVGNPELMNTYLQLSQVMGQQGQSGNGNGEMQSTPQPGMLPAQSVGGLG